MYFLLYSLFVTVHYLFAPNKFLTPFPFCNFLPRLACALPVFNVLACRALSIFLAYLFLYVFLVAPYTLRYFISSFLKNTTWRFQGWRWRL
jgi:hypothetical protein